MPRKPPKPGELRAVLISGMVGLLAGQFVARSIFSPGIEQYAVAFAIQIPITAGLYFLLRPRGA